jgi:hypothetical protein
MSKISLLEPLLGNGIRNSNFFNGRLLSAEDLRAEQQANREHNEQLGRAIGEGVAYGLEVERKSGSSPGAASAQALVNVSRGLAVNRRGQTLWLADDTEVALVRGNPTLDEGAGLFVVCPGVSSSAVPTGTGVYLLVITPASGFEGRAPASGLGESQILSGKCGSRYTVEGVQFRLIDFNFNAIFAAGSALRAELDQLLAVSGAANLSKLRSLLAYLCFGAREQQDFLQQPFGAQPLDQYGALDALRTIGSLTDCDVPLALIYWTGASIQFVDSWAARRRLTERPATAIWNSFTGDRRLKEAEAMFLQFQAQVEEMRKSGAALEPVVAVNYFRYLPPVGILPLTGKAGVSGFDFPKFFDGLDFKPPVFIEGATVEPLIRNSLSYAPLDLGSNQPVWLYSVRENMEAVGEGGSAAPQPYLIFASGYTPYQGKVEVGDPDAESIDIKLLDFAPRTITADLTASFRFNVTSHLAEEATLTFKPDLRVKVNKREWTLEVDPPERELQPDEETQVTVLINPVPDGTLGTPFSIGLAAISERLTGKSELYDFTVGKASGDIDATISLKFSKAILKPAANTVSDKAIGFPRNNEAEVTLIAEIGQAGKYEVTATIDPSKGWNWKVLTPVVVVDPRELGRKKTTALLKFAIAPKSGADDSVVEFSIGKRGARERRTYTMSLLVGEKVIAGGRDLFFNRRLVDR